MMEIINCEQGTPEWFAARAGIVTASEFQTLLMKGKGGGDSATRRTYMRKLAGEIITGEPSEGFSNVHTERGKAMEPEARDLYAFMADCEPQQVGFIRNGRKGASPDSLIGDKGGLEIKTRLPHLMIELLEKDEVPPEHIAQIQGGMWVGEREWWDFVAYWPKLPLFVKRVYRDEGYIKTLAAAVDQFNEELDALVSRIRAYGMKEAA
jgi:hypothetical protein